MTEYAKAAKGLREKPLLYGAWAWETARVQCRRLRSGAHNPLSVRTRREYTATAGTNFDEGRPAPIQPSKFPMPQL